MQIVSNTEEVVQRCSAKKVFLEISQNSQQSTCARVSFLIKLQAWHMCFPVNFVKFLRKPFFIEHLWWLLLLIEKEGKNKFSAVPILSLQRLLYNRIKIDICTCLLDCSAKKVFDFSYISCSVFKYSCSCNLKNRVIPFNDNREKHNHCLI